MHFDVIIGNPPYQSKPSASGFAKPIYHDFVEAAKILAPSFISFLIPSRWMAGGKGLRDFQAAMLSDPHVSNLIDYIDGQTVFESVDISGGVCYFLRDSQHAGPCNVTTINQAGSKTALRSLNTHDVFIRDLEAIPILEKVLAFKESQITTIFKSGGFGFETNFTGFSKDKNDGDIPIFYTNKNKRGIGFVHRDSVFKNKQDVDCWKVFVPSAGSPGLGRPIVAPPPSVATNTFNYFLAKNKTEAESITSYYGTLFFSFLVSLRKISQHASYRVYEWVPLQIWDRMWSDQTLFEKYSITENERVFIGSACLPAPPPHPR